MQILVVEDDVSVSDFISKGLRDSGFAVVQAFDGNTGLDQASSGNFEAIVMDRMLPGQDGLSIIKAIRAARNQTPVLILSALGEVDDRVRGLQAGGDDYLVKPFALAELLARIEALRRRKEAATTVTRLHVADLEMDLLTHKVVRAGKNLVLQPREFRLLEYLMKNAGQVVTRTMLLEKVWDYHFDPQTNVIDVHISRLRQKLDKEFERPLLKTVRGEGYVLGAPESPGETDAL